MGTLNPTIPTCRCMSIPTVKRFRPKTFLTTFLPKFDLSGPKKKLNVNFNYFNPKRHILAWNHVVWAIALKIRWGVWGELPKKRKVWHLFAQFVPAAFPGRNHVCKILCRSVQGFRFCRGSKFAHIHWLSRSCSRYQFSGRYRAACDFCSISLLWFPVAELIKLLFRLKTSNSKFYDMEMFTCLSAFLYLSLVFFRRLL